MKSSTLYGILAACAVLICAVPALATSPGNDGSPARLGSCGPGKDCDVNALHVRKSARIDKQLIADGGVLTPQLVITSSEGITSTAAGTIPIGSASNPFGYLFALGLKDTNSDVRFTGQNGSPSGMFGDQADGAAAVGNIVDTLSTYSTAGSKLLSVRNNGTEKSAFDFAGALLLPTAGAAGPATVVHVAQDGADNLVLNVPNNKSIGFRINGSTQWTVNGTSFGPSGDVAENLGTSATRIADAFIRTVKDASSNVVADFSGAQETILNGRDTDAASAAALRIGNTATLSNAAATPLVLCSGTASANSCAGSTLASVDIGGAWNTTARTMPTGSWDSLQMGAVAASPEATSYAPAARFTGTGYFGLINCSWEAAGTGGTTGVVMKIRNVTDSSDLCSCTLGGANNCTLASASGPVSCSCNTAFVAAKSYAVQMSASTDCSANPQKVYCSVEIAR